MRDPAGRVLLADADLESALRDLARELAIPSLADGGTRLDPAARASARIAAGAVPGRRLRVWSLFPTGLPLRRAVALAAIAVLAVAVIAGALGLGLPGIRIVQAPSGSPGAESARPSPASPSPASPLPATAGPVGSDMGLGDLIPIAG